MRDGLTPPGSAPDDPTDDELRRALRDMAAAASTRPVGEPTEIRRVARRRQVTSALATAAAVVLIATSAVVAAPTLLDAGPPADSPSTPAPTATIPSPSPSPSLSPSPEVTPSTPPATGTPPPSSPSPSSTPSTPRTSPTEIPDGYRMPRDGHTEEVAYWPFPSCDGRLSGARPAGASDMRAMRLPSMEPVYHEAVAVYPSADAAVAAMGALRDAVDRCGPQTEQIIERAELPGPWADGFVRFSGSSEVGDSDPWQARAFQHVYVVRVGNAIGLTHNSYFGPLTSHEPTPENIAENREPIDRLAPTLCVFTEAGC